MAFAKYELANGNIEKDVALTGADQQGCWESDPHRFKIDGLFHIWDMILLTGQPK